MAGSRETSCCVLASVMVSPCRSAASPTPAAMEEK